MGHPTNTCLANLWGKDTDISILTIAPIELPMILAVVEKIHQTLHSEGCVRLVSYLKLETRTDKTPTLAGKKL